MDANTQRYFRILGGEQQHGGAASYDYPIFVGSGQNGRGLGDILKSIWRFIAPVAARGASTFLGEMVKGHDAGGDWKSAAKSALAPAATEALSQAVGSIPKPAQSGNGRKRKGKPKQYKSHKVQPQDFTKWNF